MASKTAPFFHGAAARQRKGGQAFLRLKQRCPFSSDQIYTAMHEEEPKPTLPELMQGTFIAFVASMHHSPCSQRRLPSNIVGLIHLGLWCDNQVRRRDGVEGHQEGAEAPDLVPSAVERVHPGVLQPLPFPALPRHLNPAFPRPSSALSLSSLYYNCLSLSHGAFITLILAKVLQPLRPRQPPGHIGPARLLLWCTTQRCMLRCPGTPVADTDAC